MEAFTRAATNRSIRTIQTELDFLLDASLLTPSQVSSIQALLPSTSSASSFSNTTTRDNTISPQATASLPSPAKAASPNPPSYAAAGGPAPIATASALYAYSPTDAGDVALALHDRISILEWMNADWARGRNERTGLEGIFPRSYVRVDETNNEKSGFGNNAPPPLPPVGGMQKMNLGGYQQQQPPQGSGYGNMPMEVANGQQQMQMQPPPGGHGRMNEQGKKFGKKLGNAAIFGAGASIGSNIVNAII